MEINRLLLDTSRNITTQKVYVSQILMIKDYQSIKIFLREAKITSSNAMYTHVKLLICF